MILDTSRIFKNWWLFLQMPRGDTREKKIGKYSNGSRRVKTTSPVCIRVSKNKIMGLCFPQEEHMITSTYQIVNNTLQSCKVKSAMSMHKLIYQIHSTMSNIVKVKHRSFKTILEYRIGSKSNSHLITTRNSLILIVK